jgi:hypothetical protein
LNPCVIYSAGLEGGEQKEKLREGNSTLQLSTFNKFNFKPSSPSVLGHTSGISWQQIYKGRIYNLRIICAVVFSFFFVNYGLFFVESMNIDEKILGVRA